MKNQKVELIETILKPIIAHAGLETLLVALHNACAHGEILEDECFEKNVKVQNVLDCLYSGIDSTLKVFQK